VKNKQTLKICPCPATDTTSYTCGRAGAVSEKKKVAKLRHKEFNNFLFFFAEIEE